MIRFERATEFVNRYPVMFTEDNDFWVMVLDKEFREVRDAAIKEGIEVVTRFCNPSVHDDAQIKGWVEAYYSWYIHHPQEIT